MKHARLDPLCDVRHCDGARPHNGRLCVRCETRLPAYLRVAIMTAHDERRGNDWRDACSAAASYLSLGPRSSAVPTASPPAPAMPRISPERAAAGIARLLGERD